MPSSWENSCPQWMWTPVPSVWQTSGGPPPKTLRSCPGGRCSPSPAHAVAGWDPRPGWRRLQASDVRHTLRHDPSPGSILPQARARAEGSGADACVHRGHGVPDVRIRQRRSQSTLAVAQRNGTRFGRGRHPVCILQLQPMRAGQ
eukprot:scaffold62392_cov69-Phaeocystis_antarctica.AAC.1